MDLAEYNRRRRPRWARRWALFLISFAGLTALGWGALWVPYFRVSAITVSGADDNDGVSSFLQGAIRPRKWFAAPRDNYFLLSTSELETLLASQGFGAAHIQKQFPHTLLVIFPNDNPKFIFCPYFAGDCFYINKEGIAFSQAPHFSQNPLSNIHFSTFESFSASDMHSTFKLGDRVLTDTQIQFINTFLDRLQSSNISFTDISLPEDFWTFRSAEGWRLFIDPARAPEDTARDLIMLLDQKIKDKRALLDYIDLRLPNKAFYKFR